MKRATGALCRKNRKAAHGGNRPGRRLPDGQFLHSLSTLLFKDLDARTCFKPPPGAGILFPVEQTLFSMKGKYASCSEMSIDRRQFGGHFATIE
jgi:hypothetical protein